MTDVRLPDPVNMLDGFASLQQFSQLSAMYVALLQAGEGPPDADDRRTLLELGRRSVALIDPADLFVQACLELTEQAAGPEFETRLRELVDSDALGPALKEPLSKKDLLKEAKDGGARLRSVLADERTRLQEELRQLQAGQRPVRSTASDDVDLPELGGGMILTGAGGILAVSVALAPKTAGASLLVGGAVLSGMLVGGGIAVMIDAVT
jgi:hypothetical protein